MSLYRSAGRVRYVYCKYCGAKLRRDSVGQHCPSKNCKWSHGLPARDDTPTRAVATADAAEGAHGVAPEGANP